MSSRRLILAATACLVLATSTARAEIPQPDASTPDVLIYNDGDRVRGRLLRREEGMLVFQSPRFGELRVPAAAASLVTEGASAGPLPGPGESTAPETSTPDSPHHLRRALRSFFGPWSGRFTASFQLAQDANERADLMLETAFTRTWLKDEVNLTARYDFNETDDITSTSILRGAGMWRHTLPKRLFTVYRPSYEWHRGSTLAGISHNYVLLQQEIGIGVNVVDRDAWKLRIGVAENFFNNWDIVTDSEHSARVESVFLETNVNLPWRIVLTERAVYYYSFETGGDGWEHQFELTKKLTDTLSLGLRHEARYNAPDVRSADYSLLRVLLGLDF